MWYASSRQAVAYVLASPAFCEYGGTQTTPGYDGRPVDMPPMVSVSIGGIRPCLTIV